MRTARAPGGERARVPQGQRRAGAGWSALPVLLLGAVAYLELVLRARVDAPFLTTGLAYALAFAAVTALVVSLLAGALGGRAREVMVGLALTVLTLLFSTQLIYYDIFGTFYTAYSASNAGQVAQFAGDVVDRARANAAWLLMLSLPLVLFLLSRLRVARPPRHTWAQQGILAGVLVLVVGGTLAGIQRGDRGQNSPYAMYYREQHQVTAVHQLGLLTAMRVDLQRHLFGVEQAPPPPPPPALVAPEPHTPGATATPPPGSDDAAEVTGDPPDPSVPPVAGDNALDIDFERLAADAGSEELRAAHRYFGAREPTAKNEHTGRFEGYNLIFVTAEAYSHLAVDPDVTPTLHRMVHEGFHLTDVYTPIWGVSTSDGEYVATTGLIPKSGVWSMYHSGTNAMPFAMGHQLRRLGYDTYAFHNHTHDYYRRDVSHPNLGYDYRGVGAGLEVARTWPPSDLEMIDVTTPEVLASEPFHAYYMTVSGHLEYNFGGNFIAAKNREFVADLPYTQAGRAYLATQIELDRAMELLLERLEEAGVADRTLIVLSSDHYPYGLTREQIEDLEGDEVDGVELYRNSIIMYAPGMEPETVEEPVSSLDILPTLSNLMGLDFDSRLLMGRDIFSDADPLVIFSDRSFLTDLGHYDSLSREFTPAEGVTVPEGYQQAISDEIDRRFYYSTLVLDQDYYSLVVDR